MNEATEEGTEIKTQHACLALDEDGACVVHAQQVLPSRASDKYTGKHRRGGVTHVAGPPPWHRLLPALSFLRSTFVARETA